MGHVPEHLSVARREAAWRESIGDAEVEARKRLDRIARSLGCAHEVRQTFVLAGLEVAREFAAQTSYAGYEHRTGQLWPEEWRGLDEEERATAWRFAIEALDAALHSPHAATPLVAVAGDQARSSSELRTL